MKLKAALLFITILVLLMGVATANDLTADTTSTDTLTSDTPIVLEKAVQEKQTVSPGDTNTVEKINKTRNKTNKSNNNHKKHTKKHKIPKKRYNSKLMDRT